MSSTITRNSTDEPIPINRASSILGTGDKAVLLSAFLSFLFSVALWFGIGMPADKSAGLFVGIWVPSILATGIFFHVARATRNDH